MDIERIKNLKYWDKSKICQGIIEFKANNSVIYEFYFDELILEENNIEKCYGKLAVLQYDTVPVEIHCNDVINTTRLIRMFYKESRTLNESLETAYYDFIAHYEN